MYYFPIKNFFEPLVEEVMLDEFAEWAFGSDFMKLEDGTDFLDEWNSLHGDEYTVSGSDSVDSSSLKMVEMWKKSKGIPNKNKYKPIFSSVNKNCITASWMWNPVIKKIPEVQTVCAPI